FGFFFFFLFVCLFGFFFKFFFVFFFVDFGVFLGFSVGRKALFIFNSPVCDNTASITTNSKISKGKDCQQHACVRFFSFVYLFESAQTEPRCLRICRSFPSKKTKN